MTACSLRWCRLDEGHDELHQDHVAAVIGQRRASVALTIEAASKDTTPLPVLTAGNGTVARVEMGWDELHELACAMLTAHRRHAAQTSSGADADTGG